MSVPHYTARKVGDSYVMVRTDTPMGCKAPLSVFAGSALIACGLLRRGMCGLLCAAVGGGTLYHGITGRNPLTALAGIGRGRFNSGPTFPRDEEAAAQSIEQTPDDEVEEASMESFPASDPPARMSPARR